ncbi:MAG: hypothetical protein HKN49_08480 [Gammaproteobacteria bacterium]|nr:hypothetical protein [Gammaproteobacteria bacterium]
MKATPDQDPGTDRGLKEGLLAAFRRLLRPLARILIRHGIAYGEFAEVAKTVFVEAAAEDFALPGRKSSGSRIAILTGLTRKEVKRLLDQAKQGKTMTRANPSRAGRVLAGWHSDPRFTGPYGLPLELPFDSETDPSFSELVRRYSGDMPARAMLEELVRVQAVEMTPDERIKPLGRVYIPFELDKESVERLGQTLADLGETLSFNLDPSRGGTAKFERRVYQADPMSGEKVERFHLVVADKGQALLEYLDDWLDSHTEETSESPKYRAGVGIYFFSSTLNEPEE